MKEWIKKNGINLAITIIYAAIVLVVIICHEQWRDESQQWLLTRDLSISELFSQMKYEGHFMLWYMILMPFAKLGFPFITVNIISWIIMTFTVWVLLSRSPFKKEIKYLFVFSSPFLYYYSVVSRVYCLIPLAEILIAMTYKERVNKPFRYLMSLLFLANTHIVMWGQVGVFFLDYIISLRVEKKNGKEVNTKRNIYCVVVFCIGMILSIIPILTSVGANPDADLSTSITFADIFDLFIYQPIMQLIRCFYVSYGSIIMILAIAILLVAFVIKKYTVQVLELFVTSLWQYAIYVFLYYANMWRALLIIPELICFMWIIKEKYDKEVVEKDKRSKNMVCFLLFLSALNGLAMVIQDIKYNFSNSKDMAKYINENLDDNSIIITGDIPEMCTPIIANNCNVEFYSINLEEKFTYMTYGEKLRRVIDKEDILDTIEKFSDKDVYYIYITEKIFDDNDEEFVKQLVEEGVFTEVYASDVYCINGEEKYILYKVNEVD